jgi:hypothetical protein
MSKIGIGSASGPQAACEGSKGGGGPRVAREAWEGLGEASTGLPRSVGVLSRGQGWGGGPGFCPLLTTLLSTLQPTRAVNP